MADKLLELQNISKAFGGLTVIQNLDLHVDEGEIVSVIGPNGAGKTTLFNLITGVYRPDSGDIRFANESLLGLEAHQITGRGIARMLGEAGATVICTGRSSRKQANTSGHHYAGRPETIETTSLHLDVLRDLRRIHSHICSVAYPVLDAAGELAAYRSTESDLVAIPNGAAPSTTR